MMTVDKVAWTAEDSGNAWAIIERDAEGAFVRVVAGEMLRADAEFIVRSILRLQELECEGR